MGAWLKIFLLVVVAGWTAAFIHIPDDCTKGYKNVKTFKLPLVPPGNCCIGPCHLRDNGNYECNYLPLLHARCVDGIWSAWGDWGRCRKGKKKRYRECNSPAPDFAKGGRDCEGDGKETRKC